MINGHFAFILVESQLLIFFSTLYCFIFQEGRTDTIRKMRKLKKNNNCCRQKTQKKTAMVCVYLNLMQKREISFKARKQVFFIFTDQSDFVPYIYTYSNLDQNPWWKHTLHSLALGLKKLFRKGYFIVFNVPLVYCTDDTVIIYKKCSSLNESSN